MYVYYIIIINYFTGIMTQYSAWLLIRSHTNWRLALTATLHFGLQIRKLYKSIRSQLALIHVRGRMMDNI